LLPFSPCCQDIHFTENDINPILFNAAYAGFFEGQGRFGLAYRNQWASVTNPFQTLAATAEVALLRRRYQRDGLSLGMIAYADQEGTLNYGITSISGIISYFKALDDINLISVGIEGGYGHSGFDLSNAHFYETGENIEELGVNYPLLGGGIAWHCQPNDALSFKFGLSGRNLNRPNISYLGLTDTYLERHFNLYARAEYRYWPSVSLLPTLAFQWQNNYSEYILGLDAKWYLRESSRELVAFAAGLTYRWRDAMNVTLSMDYNAFLFAFSYDANLSKLTTASRSIGAFEMQVVYHLDHSSKIKHKALPCPII
jgi:type IX secretion system PorP/SprF family membrane protein